ncbi:hypothetical protein FHS72_000540 [Loktanella ponticola]|uniref:DUF4177 domain-containing protein n=1 Tax=Yoonia ponticola TaxID=1524255 RepID=A0A7W9BI73_9RHOB|nr:hypothetical protein [Yoonia ponticola]MBB5720936.1 hypothetical protein [Yoonia ponticola]
MYKMNKVVRVNFSGGLLGLVLGSSRGKIESVVQVHNRDGWNVAEVIPYNPNLALILLRFVILVLTLGLWTISTGFLFILEKPTDLVKNPQNIPNVGGRIEPTLR